MKLSAYPMGMRRRYAAEFVGTFAIVFAPVALSASGKLPGGDDSLAAAAWVSGLAVLAMVYALGPVSAAHFNPAVTLGFAIARRFPCRFVLPYIVAQVMGSLCAASAVYALFGATGAGTHTPAASAIARAIGLEAVLTFFLMLVIMAVATDTRVAGPVPAIAIGLTVVFDVWIGGPVSGGSMNPARSLGPAALSGGVPLSSWWVYLIGPCLGAMAAALCFERLLRLSTEHACGAPGDLCIPDTSGQ
jgi:MIP family channel proteins